MNLVPLSTCHSEKLATRNPYGLLQTRWWGFLRLRLRNDIKMKLVILDDLARLEAEIQAGMAELREMLQ